MALGIAAESTARAPMAPLLSRSSRCIASSFSAWNDASPHQLQVGTSSLGQYVGNKAHAGNRLVGDGPFGTKPRDRPLKLP